MTASQDQAIPLLDIGRGNRPLLNEISAAFQRVCESGRFLHGPDVRALEESFCRLCKVEHAIGCASGSDALLLAMMAADLGPGDEVIMPSFSFFATASAAWRLGAKPVFVDIDPATYNLDPEAVAAAITPATKVIIPVHLFGQCAPMDAINELGREHDVLVVEDAAQAVGARFADRPAGSMGHIGCFSFYPTKNLGGFGDGGMLTTNDECLAEKLRLLSAHGMNPRYYHNVVGINSRLDSVQAAVLNIKIQHLDEISRQRRENAKRYEQLLRSSALETQIILPTSNETEQYHVWNQYTIRVLQGCRDGLRQYLADRRIGTEIYYPVPLHEQECFQSLNVPLGSLPHTERISRQVLSLPIFAELRDDEQETVARTITDFCLEQRISSAA